MMECYNVMGDINDGDDPHNLDIADSKGSWDIATPTKPVNEGQQPIKTLRINIGMTKNPNFSNVKYY